MLKSYQMWTVEVLIFFPQLFKIKIELNKIAISQLKTDFLITFPRQFQDKTCYELKNLEPKCQYFLQVQAVSLYGVRRLASRKASKVFNSTDYMSYGKIKFQLFFFHRLHSLSSLIIEITSERVPFH